MSVYHQWFTNSIIKSFSIIFQPCWWNITKYAIKTSFCSIINKWKFTIRAIRVILSLKRKTKAFREHFKIGNESGLGHFWCFYAENWPFKHQSETIINSVANLHINTCMWMHLYSLTNWSPWIVSWRRKSDSKMMIIFVRNEAHDLWKCGNSFVKLNKKRHTFVMWENSSFIHLKLLIEQNRS